MPCRAHEVKKPTFGTEWGGWINGNSVGLGPEERILVCPSAWLMKLRLIIELSTPKISWDGYLNCPAGLARWKNPFSAPFGGGGGWINGSSVGLDSKKRILGYPSAWLMENSLLMLPSTPKIEWAGYLKCPVGLFA